MVDALRRRGHGAVLAGLVLFLAVVARPVSLHGGAVQAHSGSDGAGSTFIVTLPLDASSADGPAADAAASRVPG
ncbi:HAMP domain-containing histidine kinase [Ramlibacter humi]|uniref:HAMP domain-containing histidine kinase n=1 Tax=Ramlibacter humi TaxID=2530451 RepID=A0A4Z0BFC7_9BURK|nr:HAMP domain-containing histidine kinase [Ramlibacter humi]TFY97017.1 HAMP domain-containing histidine kinase [Ramlibacter humi]